MAPKLPQQKQISTTAFQSRRRVDPTLVIDGSGSPSYAVVSATSCPPGIFKTRSKTVAPVSRDIRSSPLRCWDRAQFRNFRSTLCCWSSGRKTSAGISTSCDITSRPAVGSCRSLDCRAICSPVRATGLHVIDTGPPMLGFGKGTVPFSLRENRDSPPVIPGLILKPIGSRLLAEQIERMTAEMLDQTDLNDSPSEGRKK